MDDSSKTIITQSKGWGYLECWVRSIWGDKPL